MKWSTDLDRLGLNAAAGVLHQRMGHVMRGVLGIEPGGSVERLAWSIGMAVALQLKPAAQQEQAKIPVVAGGDLKAAVHGCSSSRVCLKTSSAHEPCQR
jgi:hypothetical protein